MEAPDQDKFIARFGPLFKRCDASVAASLVCPLTMALCFRFDVGSIDWEVQQLSIKALLVAFLAITSRKPIMGAIASAALLLLVVFTTLGSNPYQNGVLTKLDAFQVRSPSVAVP